MISVIADCIEYEVVKAMQQSPFLGIMIDESTDLSVRKNLVVYANILERSGDVC